MLLASLCWGSHVALFQSHTSKTHPVSPTRARDRHSPTHRVWSLVRIGLKHTHRQKSALLRSFCCARCRCVCLFTNVLICVLFCHLFLFLSCFAMTFDSPLLLLFLKGCSCCLLFLSLLFLSSLGSVSPPRPSLYCSLFCL